MLKFQKIAIVALAIVIFYGAASFSPKQAEASSYTRTAIWVYIDKHPSEGIWEACRRVYGRDVYQVRHVSQTSARCFVNASQASNPLGS